MSSFPGLPTTVDEALALVANASPSVEYVENGGDPAEYAAILQEIAENRPEDRNDFSKTIFHGVLNADGSTEIGSLKSNVGGTPVFEYSGDAHAEDSFWTYREIDYEILSGPAPETSVTQAVWTQASGKTYRPFFPRRIKTGEIRRFAPPTTGAQREVK